MALCPGGIWAAIVRRWCDLSRMGDRVCVKGKVWACGLWPACGRFGALLELAGGRNFGSRGDRRVECRSFWVGKGPRKGEIRALRKRNSNSLKATARFEKAPPSFW